MKYILLLLVLFPVLAVAQQDKTHYQNLDKNGLAIQGYDPVSYFLESGPQKGSEELTLTYKGATYRFVNIDNRDAFQANPEKYIPAYGGYCTYAMGKDYLADVNPTTFKILDGKLLLFYNKLFVNTLNRWNKDEETLFPNAEKNWEEKSAFEN